MHVLHNLIGWTHSKEIILPLKINIVHQLLHFVSSYDSSLEGSLVYISL